MKKTATEKIQTLCKLTSHSELDLRTAFEESPQIIQDCILATLKEIRRLNLQNVNQEVKHYSAMEKAKAEKKSKYNVHFIIPDNGRGKIPQKSE
jgi:hypothetical protein